MRVRVERCFCGNGKWVWRLSAYGMKPVRLRDLNDGKWTRATATDARNLIELEWSVPRRNVRFEHA